MNTCVMYHHQVLRCHRLTGFVYNIIVLIRDYDYICLARKIFYIQAIPKANFN